MKKIEVIALTVKDAILIERAGAHRIELVIELERGGLTPSLELVKEVVDSVSIPVRVMVRDTDASFVYDDKTMESHIAFIKELQKIKPDGIVFGSLDKNNRINFDQLEEVIRAKGDLKLTFHRAFDELGENAIRDFDMLATFPVDTLLTSGTMATALEGKNIIKTLVDKKAMEILPGKSISLKNAKELIEYTNVSMIHVGYAVRVDGNALSPISINKIKEIIKEVNND